MVANLNPRARGAAAAVIEAKTQFQYLLPDRRDARSREQLIRRVRAEFQEMPGLRLTLAQAVRLFGLREDICGRVLATLVNQRVLSRGVDGQYAWPSR